MTYHLHRGGSLGAALYPAGTPPQATTYLAQGKTPPQCASNPAIAASFATCAEAQAYESWWRTLYTSDASCAQHPLCQRRRADIGTGRERPAEFVAATTPVARAPIPDSFPNPLDQYMASGCDASRPNTPAESALLLEGARWHAAYLDAYVECKRNHEPAIEAAAARGDAAAVQGIERSLLQCLSETNAYYEPLVLDAYEKFQALCAELARPPEYPAYSLRPLPPSVLPDAAVICAPQIETEEEAKYLAEIERLETMRRNDYSACINRLRPQIKQARAAGAPVAEVSALQDDLVLCVNDVLTSYGSQIAEVVSLLSSYCASVPVDEPGEEYEGAPESTPETIYVEPDEQPLTPVRAGMSGKSVVLIGGLLLAVGAGTAYYLSRKARKR